MGMAHMGGMMMQMYFTASSRVTILFEGWATKDAGQLFGSMIAIFLLGMAYELLKYWRERLESNNLERIKNRITAQPGTAQEGQKMTYPFFGQHHLTQTAMHLVQIALGYCLMLIAMTYNVWCFLAVILGSTAGYFLVGYRRYHVTQFSDHCT